MAPISSPLAIDTAATNEFEGSPSILSASTEIYVSSPNATAWHRITDPQRIQYVWDAVKPTKNPQKSVEEPPNEAYLCQPNKEYLFFWGTSFTLSVASTMLTDLLHVSPIEEALAWCHTQEIQCDSATEARLAEIGTQLKYVLNQHLSSISPDDLIQDQGMTIPQRWTCYAVMVLGMLIGNTCLMDTPMKIFNNIQQVQLKVQLFGVGQQAGKTTMIFQHTRANMEKYGLNNIAKVMLDLKDASSFQTAGIFWEPDDLQALRRLDDFARLLEDFKNMAEGSLQTDHIIYPCTYENCGMVFLKKVEWMRHEISNHNAGQYWICQIDGQPTTCYNISHDPKLHKLHLLQHHNISSEGMLEVYVARDLVNSGHQPQYFCGYCVNPVQRNQEKGKNAWHERFDHMEEHMRQLDKLLQLGHECTERGCNGAERMSSSSLSQPHEDQQCLPIRARNQALSDA